MGVYIPNMEKPKSCEECPLTARDEWEDLYCVILTDDILAPKGIMTNCPLIEIDTDDPELSAFFEQLFPLLAELQRGSQVYDRSTRRKENR